MGNRVWEIIKDFSNSVLLGLLLTPVFLAMIFSIIYSPAFYFDWTQGDRYERKVLDNISIENKTAHEAANNILFWEQKNLKPMYMRYDGDSYLNTLGLYNINGSWTYFHRGVVAPHNYILKQGLANCGEFSTVFVRLMEEAGHEARVLSAPVDDHQYALYQHQNESFVVNPSSGKVVDGDKFADRKNFSKILAGGLSGKPKDVTSRYLDEHNITLKIEAPRDDENFVISVSSLTAIRKYPGKYESGEKLAEKDFSGKKANFNLSESLYRIKLEEKGLVFSNYYSKTVSIEKPQKIVFDLKNMSARRGLPSLF